MSDKVFALTIKFIDTDSKRMYHIVKDELNAKSANEVFSILLRERYKQLMIGRHDEHRLGYAERIAVPINSGGANDTARDIPAHIAESSPAVRVVSDRVKRLLELSKKTGTNEAKNT